MIDLIGHKTIFDELKLLNKQGVLPKKILLNGKEGIGKSILIKNLIMLMFPKEKNLEILIENKTHPNIFFVEKKNDKKNIEISQIRDLIKFQNSSSFNNKPKIIVIDGVQFLNMNSSNALLKVLEEPNSKIYFFLINNSDYKILETIKSRCIEFKTKINYDETKLIVNNYFDKNIFQNLSEDFLLIYSSPSFIISMISFFNENKLDYEKITIDELLSIIISKKVYISNFFVKQNLIFFIELFFYKKIKIQKNYFLLKIYFYKKFSNIIKYNLDLENFFLEFKYRLLRE